MRGVTIMNMSKIEKEKDDPNEAPESGDKLPEKDA
jgi:hypothetical protein